jgi:hypothetical protein
VHILQIVIKNTSTMDFSVPLLWKIRKENPHYKITVLYCVSSKKQILRESKYFSDFFAENTIVESDYSDYLKSNSLIIKNTWQKLFSMSMSDRIDFFSLRGMFKTQKYEAFIFCIRYIFQFMLRGFEKVIALHFIRTEDILPTLNPDVIFFDNRATSNFYGRTNFFNYFKENKPSIYLLPHAPHYIHPNDFCAFDDQGEKLPGYCTYWYPFKPETPWNAVPDKKNQFVYSGYPGFDDEWIDNIMSKRRVPRNGSITCLVIGRKFLPKDYERPENYDQFTLDYKDMLSLFTNVAEHIREMNNNISLIIKPHPSSNYLLLNNLLEESGVEDYSISHEPFYSLMSQVDYVISPFSTSVLIPVMFGLPTILVKTELQEFVNNRWHVLEEIYSKLTYYSKDDDEYEVKHKEVIDICLSNKNISECSSDRNLVMNYYKRPKILLNAIFPHGIESLSSKFSK